MLLAAGIVSFGGRGAAEVEIGPIFGSGMVLQQGRPVPIWGRAEPGEKVTVEVAGRSQATTADSNGSWRVQLEPLRASSDPLTIVVRGENSIVLEDVLVGEVWLCAGQSNMWLPMTFVDDSDVEIANTEHPEIRLFRTFTDHASEMWQPSSPAVARRFSAICYLFGRELHQILGVPVGLIHSAQSNSTCEAWISRETLAGKPRFDALLRKWPEPGAAIEHREEKPADRLMARYAWRVAKREAEAEGRQPPPSPTPPPMDPSLNPERPGSLFARFVQPIVGYEVRGVLWYQGESNATDPDLYRDLFPLLIQDWRSRWGRDDLPFYWVQLPAFGAGTRAGRSDWALIRDVQTVAAQTLPHTAQAVAVDLSGPLHPKNKQAFARRLLRIALAREYGRDVADRNPVYRSMQSVDGKVLVRFNHVGGGLTAPKGAPLVGFVVSGSDRRFFRAQARIVGENEVEVWAPEVPNPVAVRYAWANNPPCNLFTTEGLPATPFRTDDWPVGRDERARSGAPRATSDEKATPTSPE